MKNKKNKMLVDALQKHIPETKKLVAYLVDILDLNKESVYRRLRNEIPFTFEEICTIVPKLGISLDHIIGLGYKDSVLFDFQMSKSTDPINTYLEIMQMNLDLLTKVKDAKVAKVELVLNRLPYAYTLHYENLAKFYYYKWFYHTQNVPSDFYFKDFVVPTEIKEIYKNYLDSNIKLDCEITILADNNLFLSMIKDINYYVNRGLITDEEQALFQQELLQATDFMENIAKTGVNKGGVNVNVYISAVDLEPSYVHIEYDNKSCVHYWTASAEILGSYDIEMCRRQKEWIQSLKRYTTLITECNARQRIEYFDKQRFYIKTKLLPSSTNELIIPFLTEEET